MQNYNETKLELLKSIGKLTNALDTEIDWYLVSLREKDSKRRRLAKNIFYEKKKENALLAKEAYERFK